MTFDTQRRYRQVSLIMALLFVAGLVARDYRGIGSIAQGVCARMLELAGEERAARASRRVAAAISRSSRGGRLYRENRGLAARVELLSEQNRILESIVLHPIRVPGLATGRDRLAQLLRNAAHATIIARGPVPWSETVTLSVGRANDVFPGDVVANGPDLVGILVSANRGTCTVRLITDRNSLVETRCARSEECIGAARGTIGAPLAIKEVPPSADVREGDLVLTSASGGMFPEGLVVGVVTSYHRTEDAGQFFPVVSATIRPLADFRSMSSVNVLRTSNERGQRNGS